MSALAFWLVFLGAFGAALTVMGFLVEAIQHVRWRRAWHESDRGRALRALGQLIEEQDQEVTR